MKNSEEISEHEKNFKNNLEILLSSKKCEKMKLGIFVLAKKI